MADTPQQHDARHGSAVRWIFWGFALVGAYFLITEHRAHVYQYLPYVLLLACPLLHLFHGHGGHGGGGEKNDDKPQPHHH
jgi:short subunit fatty acids transporter